jgi:hypothetical protein
MDIEYVKMCDIPEVQKQKPKYKHPHYDLEYRLRTFWLKNSDPVWGGDYCLGLEMPIEHYDEAVWLPNTDELFWLLRKYPNTVLCQYGAYGYHVQSFSNFHSLKDMEALQRCLPTTPYKALLIHYMRIVHNKFWTGWLKGTWENIS